MSKIIGDEACPNCKAIGRDTHNNHLIIFENGNKYCNRCNYKENKNQTEDSSNMSLDFQGIKELDTGGNIPDRGITSRFAKLYGTRLEYHETSGEIEAIYAPIYKTGDTEPCAFQRRGMPKTFTTIPSLGKFPKQFIGQGIARESGLFLIIVEGFLDTISAKQMLETQGKAWSVVGAWSTSLAQQFKDNIEWLSGFDTIVLALDQDEAGNKAIEEIAGLLPPDRIKVASYSENDPNDMLTNRKAKEFVNAVSNAKVYTPKGILDAYDVVEEFLSLKDIPSVPFPVEWEKVNKFTQGMRNGEVIVYSAASGLGKSAIVDELVDHLITNHPDTKMGILKMEHNNAVGLQSIFSVHLRRNLKLYRSDYNDDDLRAKWSDYFKEGRVKLIDHGFSGIGDNSGFLSKITGLIVNGGCTDIIIDHLHAVLVDVGDDNDTVDSIMYSLQSIAQLYQVRLHVVMHLRKTDTGGKSFETGAIPTLDDLKGSGALKQVPDTVIFMARNTQHEDETLRRVATLVVGKNRWLGATGDADKIIYEVDDNKYYPFNLDEYESQVEINRSGTLRI